jgi:hypothetical protein
MEGKLIAEDLEEDDSDEEGPRFTLQARANFFDTIQDDKYLKMISDHKRFVSLISPWITLTFEFS